MAHTPGPWRVHSEHADRIIVNGCCVYQVREMTTDDGQPSPADVRLMAAAPELASALRAIVACAHMTSPVGGKAYFISELRMTVARAAIAKAEGRE